MPRERAPPPRHKAMKNEVMKDEAMKDELQAVAETPQEFDL